MVAEIWALVMSSFVDQLVALKEVCTSSVTCASCRRQWVNQPE